MYSINIGLETFQGVFAGKNDDDVEHMNAQVKQQRLFTLQVSDGNLLNVVCVLNIDKNNKNNNRGFPSL